MRQKNEQIRKAQRQQILRAAMDSFIAKGLHKASIQDISVLSRLSPGQIYRIFASKEAIIQALADEEKEEARELIDHFYSFEKDIAKGLCEATPYLVDYLTEPSYAKISLEFSAEAARNKEFAQIFLPLEEEVHTALVHAIETSQKQGKVKQSLDAQNTAFIILALFDGISGHGAIEEIKNKHKLSKTIQTVIRSVLCP